MSGLLDLLKSASAQPAKQQLGQQFGLSEEMTEQALGALIPALSAGLKSNVSKPGGIDGLLGALQNGGHSRYLDDAALLGEAEAKADGNGILGHLLGSKEMSRSVASQAASKTGLDVSLLKQMLPVIATMAMGSLSKRSQEPDTLSQLTGLLTGGGARGGRQGQDGLSALGGIVGGLLSGGQKPSAAQSDGQGLLGALFDADKDGSAMDDIFQMVLKGRG